MNVTAIVESCIEKMGKNFTHDPWLYYSESDIHARLYCCLAMALGNEGVKVSHVTVLNWIKKRSRVKRQTDP